MNENFWDKSQSKAIQAICATGIIFHHMAQKTCAPWLPEETIVHGLDIFLNLGYLFVGIFFFCSGYGLYKSIKANPDYLKGFIGNHFRPIILLWLISNTCFYTLGEQLNHYTWFIYAILYLYVAFYISFKYCKTDKNCIFSLTGFIILYILLCEVLVAGIWCFNTIGLFLVGLLFAKYVNAITSSIRQKWLMWLLLSVAILCISFYGALKLNTLVYTVDTELLYNLLRYITALVQFIAATAFTILLFVLSHKIRLQGKVFDFIGSMTLELYLIHVVFVEFLDIDNLVLYILAVLVCSFAAAYALLWVKKGAHYLYIKFNNIFAAIRRDIKKILIGLIALIVITTAVLFIGDRSKRSELNQKIAEYKEQNIQYPDGKTSVYINGDGEQAILILRGFYDPCPTISQKALADILAENYKAVVIDFPGSGFSEDFTSERTAKNISQEIHNIAQALELTDYYLLTEQISSVYALYYVNEYPSEVQGVITIDAKLPAITFETFAVQNTTPFEYLRYTKKTANEEYIKGRLADHLGFKTLFWPTWQELYVLSAGQKNDDIACDTFFKNYANKSIKDELLHEIENYNAVQGLTYPTDIKVLDLVSEQLVKNYDEVDIDVYKHLNNLCQTQEHHKIINLVDAIYCATNNPKAIYKLILEEMPSL